MVTFYSQDADQPYCAMPEYVRTSVTTADGSDVSVSEWTRICYNEGSLDDPNTRIMCTVQYAVCLPGLQADHLLDIVHCTVTKDYYESLSADIQSSSCILLLAESNGYSL